MLTNEERVDRLEELEEEVSQCDSCPLRDDRRNAVLGTGSFLSDILFVRDCPEFEEDRTGNAWASPSTRLLEKILHAAHINVQRTFSTYLVNCRPAKGKVLAADVKVCRKHIDELIQILQPKIIVVCSRRVLQFFLGANKKVESVRGQFIPKEIDGVGETLIFPINHPFGMIRFPLTKKKEMFEDMKVLFNKAVEMGLRF